MQPDPLKRLDDWCASQEDKPTRPEGLRRLFEIGLGHAPKRGRLTHAARAHASALAGEVVDQLNDASAPPEEQAKRKRKLIHGPREFRDVRQDQHHTDARPAGKPKRP